MDLGDHSWSMVKREAPSSPGSPPAEQSYLQDRSRDGPAPDPLTTPPGDLDPLGPRRSLHSYVHFGHHGGSSSLAEELPLFTDLDQGSKLQVHKAAGLLVDPGDMYQTLALAAAQSQPGYEASSGAYMHSNANSPVYVPSSRVGSMIPSLSYPQPVSSHSVWPQTTPESPSYSTGASSRFHYPPSPPVNSGAPRESPGYSNSNQYGLSRPLSGTYPSPYNPYVAPQLSQLPSPWTGGHFDNTMLHSLQSRGTPLIRGPNGGESHRKHTVRQDTLFFFLLRVLRKCPLKIELSTSTNSRCS